MQFGEVLDAEPAVLGVLPFSVRRHAVPAGVDDPGAVDGSLPGHAGEYLLPHLGLDLRGAKLVLRPAVRPVQSAPFQVFGALVEMPGRPQQEGFSDLTMAASMAETRRSRLPCGMPRIPRAVSATLRIRSAQRRP